ncbi:MAG: hypothetical protein JKY37_15100, partial [Nannocystaceae bacterium]|nr:hypothetical protein [Nannocystaceae bacterium]
IQLVLAPGFSTAEEVSSISGRGVGLDVVRSDIEAVGGHVEIETTVGEGTCFRLALPETPELASDAGPAQPSDSDDDCVVDLTGDGELNLL